MKNKKGFTLTELLASIVILGVITLVAVPAVMHLFNKNKETAYDTKLNLIVDQAKVYVRDEDSSVDIYDSNKRYSYKGQSYVCEKVLIQDLLDEGYLSELDAENGKITNPKDNSVLNNKYVMVYIKSTSSPTNSDYNTVGIYQGRLLGTYDQTEVNKCN